MSFVLYEKEDRIAYITLNRPEKANALNLELVEELGSTWVRFRDDDEVWAGILTGAGRTFCAGVDFAVDFEMFVPKDRGREKRVGSLMKDAPCFRATPVSYGVWKPIIAAINGHALGAGLWLALECDIRVAVETAEFGIPGPSIGQPSTFTALFQRYIPRGIAYEMLLTAERMSARRAYEVGLVNRTVSPKQLLPAAKEMAERICQNSPLSMRAIKELLQRGEDMSRADAMSLTDHVIHNLNYSEDMQETVNAFLAKRPPVWKAR